MISRKAMKIFQNLQIYMFAKKDISYIIAILKLKEIKQKLLLVSQVYKRQGQKKEGYQKLTTAHTFIKPSYGTQLLCLLFCHCHAYKTWHNFHIKLYATCGLELSL